MVEPLRHSFVPKVWASGSAALWQDLQISESRPARGPRVSRREKKKNSSWCSLLHNTHSTGIWTCPLQSSCLQSSPTIQTCSVFSQSKIPRCPMRAAYSTIYTHIAVGPKSVSANSPRDTLHRRLSSTLALLSIDTNAAYLNPSDAF